METISNKVTPNNLDAEQAVLAGMFLDASAIFTVVDLIKGDDFYKPAHKLIFSCIIELYDNNEPVDIVTVSNLLINKGQLEDAGGNVYISELSDSVPTAANIAYHSKIIKEKSILRSLIQSSTETIRSCYESEENPSFLLDSAEQRIFEISEKRETQSVIHIREQIHDSFTQIESLYQDQGGITGIPTGFTELDALTSGLKNSELIILAARPSMGKSALATCIMENVALFENKGVLFSSLEMSKDNLTQRMLCSQAKVNFHELRKGFLAEKGWSDLTKAASRLSNSKIYIDDASNVSVLEVKNKARRLCAKGEIDLVIIDYMQLLSSHKKVESRQQEISEISRSLKALARELNIPVIVLSQLNRSVEARADHRPMLSDLRESGSIEQDADVVLMLFREEYYKRTEENMNVAEVIIGKNRNGPTGSVKLTFLKEFTKFENYSGYAE